MSTSILTSTRQPTNQNRIDLEGSQTVINKARQLPLHVVAFKDAFTEATQDIARIAENANPEDPDLLNVEIAAIKVRRVHRRCSKSCRSSSVFCAFCWGTLSRVRMAIKCVGTSYAPSVVIICAMRWRDLHIRMTTERRVPRDWDATPGPERAHMDWPQQGGNGSRNKSRDLPWHAARPYTVFHL